MHFYPYEPLDKNNAHNRLWEWIQIAFKDDLGVAYYRYPLFRKSGDLLREPDVVIFHKAYGVWILECKGFKIDNIQAIQGHVWEMRDWRSEQESPLIQAEDQMFALQNKINTLRELRGKLQFHFRAVLPDVKRSQWQEKGFDKHTEKSVWVYEDLTPNALKKSISEIAQAEILDEQTYELTCKVLGGTLPRREPRNIPTNTPPASPLRVIHEIESGFKAFDTTQQQIAFQVPDGPQRMRGLAGTGKTVLLAKRAAKIHIKHPDWKVGVVFFTQSLYDQILEWITIYCNELGDRDPDWYQLKVLHSWGGKRKDGFYYDLAKRVGLKPKDVNAVKDDIGQVSPGKGFEYTCLSLIKDRLAKSNYPVNQISELQKIIDLDTNEILKSSFLIEQALIETENMGLQLIPELYDALLIDEGQDLPPAFYKLLLSSLKNPKRLYWAYDEAQSIGSSIIPTATAIFGRSSEGTPRVDVSRNYPGGMLKSHKMFRCYRTPRQLLMAAHAINMGLLREGGALQGVTDKEDWKDLGYTIKDGDFSNSSVVKKLKVTITREADVSPHPIDQVNFKNHESLGDILTYRTFKFEEDEQNWIARQIKQDLENGFKPEDIFITAVSGNEEKEYFHRLKAALNELGIPAYIVGLDKLPGERYGSPDIFRLDGKVTIANIHRAKGNEAWKVYACRFQYANTLPTKKDETELEKRNEAFVALTRTRVWCVVTGLDDNIFDELAKVIEMVPILSFPAFNKGSLKRINNDEDNK